MATSQASGGLANTAGMAAGASDSDSSGEAFSKSPLLTPSVLDHETQELQQLVDNRTPS